MNSETDAQRVLEASAGWREVASEESRPNKEVILVAQDVVVRFGESEILKGASVSVARGEIHALIGPNGAGKTTLANVLTGHVKPLSGTVMLYGKPLSGAPWRRARKGLGRKFQVPRVFPRLSSEQNLMLARRRAGGNGELLEDQSLHITEIRFLRGDTLSHGWRQRLEMLMVESQQPTVAVLDEPTAGMTKGERTELAQLIVSRKGQVTYLIVEHDMNFVQSVADIVSFMHDGEVIATGTFAEIQANASVKEIYLGESASAYRLLARNVAETSE